MQQPARPCDLLQTPAKTMREKAKRGIQRAVDRVCTIPEFVISQFTYRQGSGWRAVTVSAI